MGYFENTYTWSNTIDEVPCSITHFANSLESARNGVHKTSFSNITILQKMKDDRALRRYHIMLQYVSNKEPVVEYSVQPLMFTSMVPLPVTPLSLDD